METASILNCDRSSIMLWDGTAYRAAYNWGNPPDIAPFFHQYRAPATAPLLQELMNSERGYVVINDAPAGKWTATIARIARIESMVLAAMVEPDGSPLGFMSAEYNERFGHFDEQRAELVVGAARLAQGAIITDRERTGRKHLAVELASAVDVERRRLGREIHDDPLQRLFALCLRLQNIRDETTDPNTRLALSELADDCLVASKRLRDVATDAHPDSGAGLVLGEALEDLVDRRAVAAGLPHRVTDDRIGETPPAATIALIRIADQALRNVVQHAEASNVTVTLVTTSSGGTELSIADDGCGFDVDEARDGRLGLVSMRERATAAGGSLRLCSTPGTGTVVTATIPDGD